MPVEVMRRTAVENKYLHKDFHNILNMGLEYLRTNFGDESVCEYLMQFTNSFYAPLKSELCKRGLAVIREHYEEIYTAEEASDVASFEDKDGELIVHVKACPAITHMCKSGIKPSQCYMETTRTVMFAICEGTPFGFELIDYDEATGAAVQRFYRRGERT